jgi:hypothetical protein
MRFYRRLDPRHTDRLDVPLPPFQKAIQNPWFNQIWYEQVSKLEVRCRNILKRVSHMGGGPNVAGYDPHHTSAQSKNWLIYSTAAALFSIIWALFKILFIPPSYLCWHFILRHWSHTCSRSRERHKPRTVFWYAYIYIDRDLPKNTQQQYQVWTEVIKVNSTKNQL